MHTHKLGLAALIILLLFTFSHTATAQIKSLATPAARTISVTGKGSQDVLPDQATLRFSVVTVAADPEAARSQNATSSKAAMDVIRGLGVEENKLRLDQLQLAPKREYDNETRRYIEQGFEVTRTLTVTLEDLDLLPTVIARVVQNGANRLDHVQYGLRNPDAARDQTLREAVLNARDKAILMAGALGTEVGDVLQISESGFAAPTPPPIMYQAEMRTMKADAAPEPDAFAAGEITVTATVNVVFLLK